MHLTLSALASTWLIHDPPPQLYDISQFKHLTGSLDSSSKLSEFREQKTESDWPGVHHMFTTIQSVMTTEAGDLPH